jgi:hypothetical protein
VDEATSPSFRLGHNGTHCFVPYAIKRFLNALWFQFVPCPGWQYGDARIPIPATTCPLRWPETRLHPYTPYGPRGFSSRQARPDLYERVEKPPPPCAAANSETDGCEHRRYYRCNQSDSDPVPVAACREGGAATRMLAWPAFGIPASALPGVGRCCNQQPVRHAPKGRPRTACAKALFSNRLAEKEWIRLDLSRPGWRWPRSPP